MLSPWAKKFRLTASFVGSAMLLCIRPSFVGAERGQEQVDYIQRRNVCV